MKNKHLQLKRALRTALFVLLLSVVGMTKLQAQNITFADAEAKSICVANWDTNGDGELSYAEAAVVTDLNNAFNFSGWWYPPVINSFDELQYFTSLTFIGNYAFYNCSSLTSIEIPNSVTSIGNYAFENCNSLTSIGIPNSVTSIGEGAFGICSSLISIEIPDATTFIGGWAFSGCSSLEQIVVSSGNTVYDSRNNSNAIIETSTNILVAGCKNTVIPNTVTSIGDMAFWECESLTSILIPNSVTSIEQYGFYGCSGLTSITIPNSVISIGWGVFINCSGLEQIMVEADNTMFDSRENCNAIINTVTNALVAGCKNTVIPNTVTSIEDEAFAGCSDLVSITIPNSVISIGQSVFKNCTGLTSMVIPNSVISINNNAFLDCSNLVSIDIPNSVTYLGYQVFCGCYSLTSIIIPDLENHYLGYGTFRYCSALQSITVLSETPMVLGEYVFQGVPTDILVYVPCGSIEAYQNAEGWNGFANLTGLCSGTITATVNPAEGGTVSGAGFYEGGALCTLTAIPSEGFSFLNWMENGAIVSNDSEYSFVVSGDRELVANFVEGELCTVIFELFDSYGDGFTGNYLVVTDENGSQQLTVESGSSAVYTLPFLTGSHITLTWIEGSYPEDCSFTVSYSNGYVIYQGSNVNSNFNYEFDVDCSFAPNDNIVFADPNVKSVCVEHWDTNGDGELSYAEAAAVTDLGEVFRFNSTITSFDELQYFTGLNSIGNYAFQDCYALTSIEIPNTVSYIGLCAISWCYNLGSIEIPNTVSFIEGHAFDGCYSLTSIHIPNTVSYIGEAAFSWCPNLEQITVGLGNTMYDSRESCNAIIETGSNTLVMGCKNTVIPNSVISIGNSAFHGCENLTSIEIPNSVITIGNSAFYGCDGMYSMTVLSVIPPTLGEYAFYYFNTGIPVYVPCESLEAYQNAGGWNVFANLTGLCPGTITATTNPAEGGTVSGTGYYEGGATCTLTATANSGYVFVNWTENGKVVSIDANYVFPAYGDRTLVANFGDPDPIDFADDNVKAICVANWDTNGDGELSYAEAVAVTDLGWVFAYNDAISSFDEFQYFTSLTSIGNWAFHYCYNLNSIIIPNSVTSIGEYAFQGCSGLALLTVLSIEPPTVGWAAFEGINRDIPVYVPCGSVESYSNEGWGGFYSFLGSCPSEITTSSSPIEGGLTSGGGTYDWGSSCTLTATANEDYTFMYWTENGEVVSTEANYTFTVMNDRDLVANFALPFSITASVNPADGGTVTGMGEFDYGSTCTLIATANEGYAFSHWKENGEVVSSEAEYSFLVSGERALVANFGNPNPIIFADAEVKSVCVANWDTNGDGELSYAEAAAVTDLGTTFRYNTTITSFDELQYFTELTSIGNAAFYNCTSMTSITIPSSVTSIGNYVFGYCSGLTSITIPSSVTSIGRSAFYYCTNLTSMTVLADIPPTLGQTGTINQIFRVYIPCGSLGSYQTAQNWSELKLREMCDGEVTVMASPTEGGMVSGAGFYEGGETCTLVAIANEGYSFINWTENDEVVSFEATYVFPNAGDRVLVANFGSNEPITFVDANVKALCVANWDTNGDGELSYAEAAVVMDLGYVFENKSNITSFDELQYFMSLTSIRYYAFYNCTSMTSITIPNSLTSIGNNAFCYCSGLASIDIPNTVTSIGEGAFVGCSSLISIEIPDATTFIGGWAFSGCSSLEQIVVSSGNTVYDSRNNCNAIIETSTNTLVAGCKNTVIPNTVASIGNYAFEYCSSLTSIEIPNSVTSIGNEAFYNCTSLTSVMVLADNPPVLLDYAFSNVNPFFCVYVPCGSLEAYQAAWNWNFLNLKAMCDGEVTVTVNPAEGGTVSGAGFYLGGETCTLVATANEGYSFSNWMENGEVVSVESTYVFPASGDRALVANFGSNDPIIFADSNVKAICVSNWDTNGDGELSYAEAGAVYELGWSFQYNGDITTFDELQYFTGLSYIGYETFAYCTGLTSIKIPNSVTSIIDYAFYGCSGLTFMTVLSVEPPTLGWDVFYEVNKSIPVYVPCGSAEAYQSANGWNEFTNIQEVCTQIQTITLAQGWNWFSTYLDITLDDLKAALVSTGNTTITIKSKNQNIYYQNGRWRGSLNFDVAMMYKIYVETGCEITLEGLPIDPTEHSITIHNGPNWIGFPLGESMSLSNAFAGFAVNGDVIKHKGGSANYLNGHWRGAFNLEPGQGYIYKSNVQGDRTLTFPTSAK